MAVQITANSKGATFLVDDGVMSVTVTLLATDDQPTLENKLVRLLNLLQVGHPVPAPAGVAHVLQPTQLATQVPQFTGVPPVRPPDRDALLAHAVENGWELYTGDDD